MVKCVLNIGDKFNKWTVLSKSNKEHYYHCKCECGCEKYVNEYTLKSGKSKSCGQCAVHKCKIGDRFGRWTILSFIDSSYVNCRCDCGTERKVNLKNLIRGESKSCGCLRSELITQTKLKDLTGQRFGRWQVLYKADKRNGQTYWHCRCDCGNEADVYSNSLLSGKSVSCGCYKVEQTKINNFKDLTGKTFGYLTVLYRVDAIKQYRTRYHCKCKCGNELDVDAANLIHNHTRSCGCYNMEQLNNRAISLVGNRYGKLTVIELDHKVDYCRYWKCKCDCGNSVVVSGEHLRSHHTYSCGCVDTSHGGSQAENEIKYFIKSLLPDTEIVKYYMDNRKQIDIYLPEYKFGVEYNGSPFHASENGLYGNKDKYYHRDKFLYARDCGIHLVNIFDVDYNHNKDAILDSIKSILLGNIETFVPNSEIVYTDNDYDIGTWLTKYGYEEVRQIEPEYFIANNRYKVYRCGRTEWHKI